VIDQRVEQNRGKLFSLKCKFYFDGGRIVHLESREAFDSYIDPSNDMSVGVDLSVAYLVDFSGIPEKQEIRFQAFSDLSIKESVNSSNKQNYSNSSIEAQINFTNVTWGEDLYRHICAFVDRDYKRYALGKIIKAAAAPINIPAYIMMGSTIPVLIGAWSNRSSSEL
jgi:hypothetical protein